jgi:probable HAF family extracellular repeat protein
MRRFVLCPLVLGLVVLLGAVAPAPGPSQAQQATPSPHREEPPPWAEAADINEAGQIVGYIRTADAGSHAVLWADGKITALGELPGGDSSEAVAINEAGQVVGYDLASGGQHAVLWADGAITDLWPLPGGDQEPAARPTDRA